MRFASQVVGAVSSVAVFNAARTSPCAELISAGGGRVHQFALGAANGGCGAVGETAIDGGVRGAGAHRRVVKRRAAAGAAILHRRPGATDGGARSTVDGGAAIDAGSRAAGSVGDLAVGVGFAAEEVGGVDVLLIAASAAATSSTPKTKIRILGAVGRDCEAFAVGNTTINKTRRISVVHSPLAEGRHFAGGL